MGKTEKCISRGSQTREWIVTLEYVISLKCLMSHEICLDHFVPENVEDRCSSQECSKFYQINFNSVLSGKIINEYPLCASVRKSQKVNSKLHNTQKDIISAQFTSSQYNNWHMVSNQQIYNYLYKGVDSFPLFRD